MSGGLVSSVTCILFQVTLLLYRKLFNLIFTLISFCWNGRFSNLTYMPCVILQYLISYSVCRSGLLWNSCMSLVPLRKVYSRHRKTRPLLEGKYLCFYTCKCLFHHFVMIIVMIFFVKNQDYVNRHMWQQSLVDHCIIFLQ